MADGTMMAKVCIACGQDCAGKPRGKDAQGRYMCQGCMDKVKAKGAPGAALPRAPATVRPKTTPAPVAEDDSVLASLMADAPDPCPSCGSPLAKGAVVCSSCGFNKTTGEGVRTTVSRAPKEKKLRPPGQPAFSLDPTWTGLIAVAVQGVLFGACFATPVMVIPLVAVYVVCGLASTVLLIVYAIKDQQIGWLIASFLIPFVGLYYVFCVSERGHLKALMLASIVGALMMVGLSSGIIAGLGDETPSRPTRSRMAAPASEP